MCWALRQTLGLEGWVTEKYKEINGNTKGGSRVGKPTAVSDR